MATKYQNLSDYDEDLMPDKEKVSEQQYAIAVADWNPNITHALLEGAYSSLIDNGVKEDQIKVVHVPGTFELIYAAKQLLDCSECVIDNVKVHKFAAIIVLGCVIQGDTPHFDYVCQGVTNGISSLNMKSEGCPVIFGVLTTNTLQQALDRAGGIHGNKGVEGAITAIKMANIVW
ncbi:MAG: 6,7-dimethyl-8-ribityllumazine synthase [Paludibacter sp.]|nr:6,7-dimethyl-8-ribityllumazine synthase [Paludibacter sp.]